MFGARIAIATALVTTAGLIGAPVQAQPGPDFRRTQQQGRDLIAKTLRQTKATSISVAVLSGNRVVWTEQFGDVSVRGKRPTAATTYGIGSVSKVLTTMAVMRLVDEGKVALDAPVVRYLPSFRMLSPQYSQITVRMLLNHSAGFPGSDYANGVSYAPIPGYAQQVLASLSRQRLKTTPGAVNVYCNDCFTVAGELVARVSGMPFEDYIRKYVFGPLGMRHSGFQVRPATSAPVIVDGVKQPFEYTNIAASGGVVSTPRDMLRLARVFTGSTRGVISASAVSQMAVDQTTTTLKAGPRSNLRYGLGWDDMRYPALSRVGVRAWVKGGDISQHHGALMVAPDEDLAIMLSAAGTGIDSNTLEDVGGEILLNALIDTDVIGRYPQLVSTRMPAANRDARATRRIQGIYLGSGVSARITRRNNRSVRFAVYELGDWVQRPGTFRLRRDGRFWSTAQPGESLQLRRAWGRTYLILRKPAGTGTYFTSLAMGQKVRSTPTLPQWRARAGQRWLLANENPESTAWQVPWVKFDDIPGLRGSMMAYGTLVGSVPFNAGEDPELGSMFLQIPLAIGRDQFDFAVEQHGGQDVLRFASSVLRQAATVELLSTGPVTIGSRGYAEWRRAQSDMTVTLSGQSHWRTYTGDLEQIDGGRAGSPRVTVKSGSYLVVFAAPGSVVSVT